MDSLIREIKQTGKFTTNCWKYWNDYEKIEKQSPICREPVNEARWLTILRSIYLASMGFWWRQGKYGKWQAARARFNWRVSAENAFSIFTLDQHQRSRFPVVTQLRSYLPKVRNQWLLRISWEEKHYFSY